MVTTNINDIITIILAGGLLGTIGQGIRIVVGLKKLDDKRNSGNPVKETFTLNRFLISLFIGFTAGAIALLIKSPKGDLSNDLIFGIIAAGYSGADFIEGIFNTYFKNTTNTTGGGAANGGGNNGGGNGGAGGANANFANNQNTESTTTTSGELPARS